MTSAAYWFEGFDDWVTQVGAGFNTEAINRGYTSSGSSGTGIVAAVNRPGKRLTITQLNAVFNFPTIALVDDFVIGLSAINATTTNNSNMLIIDANNIVCWLYVNFDTVRVSYNPSGTANDFDVTFVITPAEHYFEIAWSATDFKLYVDNVLIYTKTWTGAVQARPYRLGNNQSYNLGTFLVDNWYVGPTRLGDHQQSALTLGTASVDTGTLTGGATPAAVHASFDGDTSYETFALSTGQKVLMALSDLPTTPTTVHGVKTTVMSRKTDAGAVVGRVRMKTGSENTIADTTNAVGYAAVQTVRTTDPHTAAAFTGAAINSMEIGILENT